MPTSSPKKRTHSSEYPAVNPTRPELSAKGKNVLITGGSSGIGAAAEIPIKQTFSWHWES
jgi:hypothetical protein